MKKFKGIFLFVLAIASFVYFLSMQLVTPYFSFNYIFLALGVCSLCYGVAIRKYYDNLIFKKVNRVIKMFIISGVIIISIALAVMGTFAMKKNTEKTDYIVVLGAGLLNGDQISATLKNRLDSTLEYIDKYDKGETIVVSGGKGSDEKISEAEVMKKYLVNHGIAENRIIMENKSTNTFENFKFSKKVIESNSGKEKNDITIKIITNGFHSFRSQFLSKRVGFAESKVYSAKTPWYLIPGYYSREFIAIGKSAIIDK